MSNFEFATTTAIQFDLKRFLQNGPEDSQRNFSNLSEFRGVTIDHWQAIYWQAVFE